MIDRETAERWGREAAASADDGNSVLAGRPPRAGIELAIEHEHKQRQLRRVAIASQVAALLTAVAAVSANFILGLVAAGALSLLGLGSLLVAARLGRAFERRMEPVGPRSRARA